MILESSNLLSYRNKVEPDTISRSLYHFQLNHPPAFYFIETGHETCVTKTYAAMLQKNVNVTMIRVDYFYFPFLHCLTWTATVINTCSIASLDGLIYLDVDKILCNVLFNVE